MSTCVATEKLTRIPKVRDWSAEGKEERERCYGPILEALRARVPTAGKPQNSVKVLLPGAGLGRLVWEVARAGYAAQGCEVSFFMLIASNFILNRYYVLLSKCRAQA